MKKRRVWKIKKAGQIGRLRLCEEQMPPLFDDRIRVATRAVGLNFADIFALAGLYSATPEGPFIPGLEFSGVVMEVGEAVTRFKPGDPVMGVIRFGGYADHIDVSPDYCTPLPDNWPMEEGAAFPVQATTAWYALRHLGDAKPGQTVLVHSAAGGVGLSALKICRALKLSVIGTVSMEGKKRFLAEQGFSRIIVRSGQLSEDLRRELSGAPLHLVLDAIGGKVQRISYEALCPTGRLVIFGAATFTPGKNRPNFLKMIVEYLRRPRLDPLAMISENKSVMAFNLIWLWQESELFQTIMEEIAALQLHRPHVGHRFPFEDAPGAIEMLRSGKSVGKVVLTV